MILLKDGEEIAVFNLNSHDIFTSDEQLREAFYQLADEGIPVKTNAGSTEDELIDSTILVPMSEESLTPFCEVMEDYGYEVKDAA